MSRYDPLQRALSGSLASAITMSFAEIERLIGRPLPKSAYAYDAWWNNEDVARTTHVQCRAWGLAGFDAEPSRTRRTVTFRRTI